jgi:broad specificity phosphatase PhoE
MNKEKIQNIYILRHALTKKNNNIDNQMMAEPADSELSDEGKLHAKKTGECLKKRNKINMIISSPTLRCVQTAKIIAKELGYNPLDIIMESKLSEVKLNDKYKNLTKQQFKELKDTDENVRDYLKFLDKKNHIKNPIELNEYLISKSTKDDKIYEPVEAVSTRVNEFIENLKNLNLENILVVSHGDTIKWLTKFLTNNVGYDNIQGKLVNNNSYCGITYFIGRNNQFFLLSAQSNAHLE